MIEKALSIREYISTFPHDRIFVISDSNMFEIIYNKYLVDLYLFCKVVFIEIKDIELMSDNHQEIIGLVIRRDHIVFKLIKDEIFQ